MRSGEELCVPSVLVGKARSETQRLQGQGLVVPPILFLPLKSQRASFPRQLPLHELELSEQNIEHSEMPPLLPLSRLHCMTQCLGFLLVAQITIMPIDNHAVLLHF